MPARRVASGQQVQIERFDVLGSESRESREFVGHVAIAVQAIAIEPARTSRIMRSHMVPPFIDHRAGGPIHCYGTAELSEEEREFIRTFVQEVRSEFEAEEARHTLAGSLGEQQSQALRESQYTITPAVHYPSKERPYHRFSCSRFVAEAYTQAGIELVHHESPRCTLADLKAAYGVMANRLDGEEFRTQMGLTGAEPWPVLLPGHIMNSLHRTTEEIRAASFRAMAGDEFYPARRP